MIIRLIWVLVNESIRNVSGKEKRSMKKNVITSRTDVSNALRGLLVFVALCVLLAGCAAQHPATARQPDVNHPAPAASPTTEPTTAAPQQTTAVPPGASAPPQQATVAPAATSPVPPPPPPSVLGFDEAVAKAAHAVFTAAPPAQPNAAVVVIDPLIDGVSGYQSKATQLIQDHITRIVKDDFPRYTINRISPESLKQGPRVLVGTFTAVNAEMKTTGVRDAYRFCLVMGDLSTGKVVAKSVARARIEDVDATPTSVFNDSPVWTADPNIQAYIATCQASKVGDPIKPEYLDGLLTAALVSEAGKAYNESRYVEALDLYRTALKTPAGDQLRVYNGIYLSLNKLGRGDQAAAFRDLVDYGIRRKRLAVKFLFRPGSVRFATSSQLSSSYDMWLQQIASQTAESKACLQITGHTSPTGSAALNDSLSLLRAEYIQTRLEEDQPLLKKRSVASGVGSRENLVGTGRDDASDELDRRVELKPISPCH
jgi:outer membrane protein OmpA-like peptidoglycan-associated protein